jgi:L-ascorbate metabolism protein UlaG (beta-lactamase superfamily)
MNDAPIITYLGQSGFLLEYNNSRLIIDPSNKKSGNHDGDIVYCTHNHMDHIGGVNVFLEKNPSAILVCNEQTSSKFSKWGDRVKVVHDGETFELTPWHFKFTRLKHGLFKGVHNLAVVVSAGDFSFAHSGDAVEFQNFPSDTVNVFAVPIAGGVTASPGKALKMITELQEPRPTIIPMHWLFRNPTSFCKKLNQKIPEIKCLVPVAGESLEL